LVVTTDDGLPRDPDLEVVVATLEEWGFNGTREGEPEKVGPSEALTASAFFLAPLIVLVPGLLKGWSKFCESLGGELGKAAGQGIVSAIRNRDTSFRDTKEGFTVIFGPDPSDEAIESLKNFTPAPGTSWRWDQQARKWIQER
jgi:hypothetical protein